jgi:signal transduction histidine kinase
VGGVDPVAAQDDLPGQHAREDRDRAGRQYQAGQHNRLGRQDRGPPWHRRQRVADHAGAVLAIQHNVLDGWAGISTAMTAGRARILVSNTGPVIPSGELERLFQPFQRLGQARIRHGDGHGLGLAIVHAIATAHGAAVTATARPEGGLDIEVSFP